MRLVPQPCFLSLCQARGRTVRLLPFLVSCALYFGLWLPEPSWPSAVTKILPVLSLVLFIWSESNGSWTPYAQGIFWGLLCSCAGDICLVWPDLFLPGIGLGISKAQVTGSGVL